MLPYDVVHTANQLVYVVNLTYGEVTVLLHDDTLNGPYKKCRTLMEADFYSLNILRQNICEDTYKNDKSPETTNRTFLGNIQVIESDMVVPSMNWIKATYPEDFI